MSLLPLAVVGITIWLVIDALKHKVVALQLRVDRLDALQARLASLQMRVETLEAGISLRAPVASPGTAPVLIPEPALPVVAPPAPTPASAPVPAPAPVPTRFSPERPASALPKPEPHVEPAPVSRPAPPAAVAASASDAMVQRHPAAPIPASDDATPEAWEVVVGTSWLNKIGVFVFVLGLALLVGYSFTRIGPAGRVAIAYLVGAGLLGTGISLEKRPGFTTYAYGLIAGGWAAVYFTTYAMHAVPQAKLIDSDLTGALALAVVAAAMIAHSIRYRSETLTAMAYVVGFATLTVTPLSGFSFVASVPLTLSLVVVANRFAWDRMAIVGLVSTYALFTIREGLYPGAWLDPQSASRYLALATYWIIFEAADILRMRQAGTTPPPTALVAVNAAAYGGATLLQVPEDTALLVNLTGAMALAYLASAVTRRLLLPAHKLEDGKDATIPFTSSHFALAISAALFAWLMHLRFSGVRETTALLVEAQVLFAAGLAMRDRWLRWTSAAVMGAAMVATTALVLILANHTRTWPWQMYSSTAAVALVAVVLLVNREGLAFRRLETLPVERAYPWLAFAAVVFILVRECAPAWLGPAGLVVAVILLEPGLRGRLEYFQQATVAGLLSATALGLHFVVEPGKAVPISLVWQVIPASMVLAFGFAMRVGWAYRGVPTNSLAVFSQTAMSLVGSALLTLLEWRAMPEGWVPVSWAASGALLVGGGYLFVRPEQRWFGYLKAGAAAGAVGIPLWQAAPESSTPIVAACCVAAALYAISGGTRSLSRRATAREEDEVAVFVSSSLATLLVVLIEWRSVPVDPLALAWGMTAAALLAVGLWRKALDLGALGGVVLAFSAVREIHLLLSGATGSLVWAWAEVLLLYALAVTSRHVSRRLTDMPALPAEETLRLTLFLVGAVILTLVVHEQVSAGWLVPAWGITGMALLLAGFVLRERALRLSGLALLFLCLARLGYDIRRLDALGRIISFVVLGLVLLAVSWTYTRFREQMKKWL